MSPRAFERPATIRLPDAAGLEAGARLDGLWLPARGEAGVLGGAVVASPHSLMGGSMNSPVAMLDAGALGVFGQPLLVIVGDRDEYAPAPALRARLAALPEAEPRVLEGVDHFLMTGLGELGSSVRSGLQKGKGRAEPPD